MFVADRESTGLPIDGSYNLNGGFKPTMKRSADLDGADFYRHPVGPPMP